MSILKNVRLYVVLFLISLGYLIIYQLYLPKPEDFTFLYQRWLFLVIPTMFFTGTVIFLVVFSKWIIIDIKEKTKIILFIIGWLLYILYFVYIIMYFFIGIIPVMLYSRYSIIITMTLMENIWLQILPGILVSVGVISEIRRKNNKESLNE